MNGHGQRNRIKHLRRNEKTADGRMRGQDLREIQIRLGGQVEGAGFDVQLCYLWRRDRGDGRMNGCRGGDGYGGMLLSSARL